MGLGIKGVLRTLSDPWVLGQVQTGFEAPGQYVGKGPLLTRAFYVIDVNLGDLGLRTVILKC